VKATFNRHDAAAVAELYEFDASLINGGEPVRSMDAIAAYLGFFSMRPQIEVRTVAVHRPGDR
jgi:hypothetical protein